MATHRMPPGKLKLPSWLPHEINTPPITISPLHSPRPSKVFTFDNLIQEIRRPSVYEIVYEPSKEEFEDDFIDFDDLHQIESSTMETPRQYDIWHQIIQYCQDDPHTLWSLSSVDKQMHHVSSPFLWRCVLLRTKPRKYQRFHAAIEALLDSRKPYASYVRTLTIYSPVTSKFGSRELLWSPKFDYYRDVCERFRSKIVTILPKLINLQILEWSTTLHFNNDILEGVRRHPNISSLNICPGSDQSWMFLTPRVPNQDSPLENLCMSKLVNLSLTLPLMLNGDVVESATGRLTSSLTMLLLGATVLKGLSLRFTRPYLVTEELVVHHWFLPDIAMTSQFKLEKALFTTIFSIATARPGFNLKLTGLTSVDLYNFLQRYPLPNLTKLVMKDQPSKGNFLSKRLSAVKTIERNNWFLTSENIIYDYNFTSPDSLILRDDGKLQEKILPLYREQLQHLDIGLPTVPVEIIAMPNLHYLRTGICMYKEKWTIEDINAIRNKCPDLQDVHLVIPWDFINIYDLNVHLPLPGWDKVKSLHLGANSTQAVSDLEKRNIDSIQKRKKDYIPSYDMISFLLRQYIGLKRLKIGTGRTVDFSHPVRQDVDRLDAAVKSFKVFQ